MSHVVAIDLVIKSIEALKRTCKELNLTFKEGQKTYRWYNNWVNDYHAADAAYQKGIKPEDYGKCEHAVEVPGSNYDIGIVTNPKGEGYIPIFDFWGTGGQVVNSLGGKDLPKLRQVYAANVTEMEAQQNGFYTQREWLPDGSLNVYVSEEAQ